MAKTQAPPARLEPEREQRLRMLLVQFALGKESGKQFDVEEMRTLGEDLWHLLGEITALRHERLQLARLAAETPQFFNPLVAYEVQALRDRLLAEAAR